MASDGIPAELVLGGLRQAGVTHAVIVPDTNQRTVLERLDVSGLIPVVRCAAEDDVFGVCAGLWLAGQRPAAVIQQLGLFAGTNVLRGMVHDQHVPLAILAGVYGRDPARPKLADDPSSAVRLCTPLLDALEIPWTLIASPADAAGIGPVLTRALDGELAHVVLLGVPTV